MTHDWSRLPVANIRFVAVVFSNGDAAIRCEVVAPAGDRLICIKSVRNCGAKVAEYRRAAAEVKRHRGKRFLSLG